MTETTESGKFRGANKFGVFGILKKISRSGPVRVSPKIKPAQLADRDRWSYAELGGDFAQKYNFMKGLAKESIQFSLEAESWWSEGDVANYVGLAASQWSNSRRPNSLSNAYLRSGHLIRLSMRFRLGGARNEKGEGLGDKAWKLFIPEVSVEAFKAALRGVNYGTNEIRSISNHLRSSSLEIPQLHKYILKCPATLAEYDQTVDLTRENFDQDVIDLIADRKAFLRNPYSMVIAIEADSGQVLGWIDIYHIPDEDIRKMINEGEVFVDPSRILPFQEACRVTRAYTASIVAKPRRFGLAHLLICGMMDFLLKFQFHGTDTFELFAIGETPVGEKLLRSYEFSFVRMMRMEAGDRGLYSRKVTKQELSQEFELFWRRYYRFDRPAVRFEICDPPTSNDPSMHR